MHEESEEARRAKLVDPALLDLARQGVWCLTKRHNDGAEYMVKLGAEVSTEDTDACRTVYRVVLRFSDIPRGNWAPFREAERGQTDIAMAYTKATFTDDD